MAEQTSRLEHKRAASAGLGAGTTKAVAHCGRILRICIFAETDTARCQLGIEPGDDNPDWGDDTGQGQDEHHSAHSDCRRNCRILKDRSPSGNDPLQFTLASDVGKQEPHFQ